MCSINNLLPSKVILAFLWLFIRQDSSELLKRSNSNFPGLTG